MIHRLTPRRKFSLLLAEIAVFLVFGVSAQAAPPNPVIIGPARFSVLTPNCIRIEYARNGHFVDTPSLFAVNRNARFNGFKLESGAKGTTIDTGAIRLSYTPDGTPLWSYPQWAENSMRVSFHLRSQHRRRSYLDGRHRFSI